MQSREGERGSWSARILDCAKVSVDLPEVVAWLCSQRGDGERRWAMVGVALPSGFSRAWTMDCTKACIFERVARMKSEETLRAVHDPAPHLGAMRDHGLHEGLHLRASSTEEERGNITCSP